MNVLVQKTIEEILSTKEDAYLYFCDVYDDFSKSQKEVLKEEFSNTFDYLYFKYIRKKAKEENYDNFFPRFNKNIDSDGNAWLLRRKKEVKKIQQKLKKEGVSKTSKFQTYSIKGTKQQKIQLFELLIDKRNNYSNPIIDKNTKMSTFLAAFSGRPIDFQPKIVFKSENPVLYFLFIRLIIGEDNTFYEKINKTSKIFIKQENENYNFKLVNGVNRFKYKSSKNYQANEIIVPLNEEIQNIFKDETFC